MSELNPYAAPAARVGDVVPAGAVDLARPETRLWAYLVDGILYAIVAIAGSAAGLTHAWMNTAHPIGDNASFAALFDFGTPAIVLAVTGVLLLFLYNCVLLYREGQTVAKRIFRIRIVRPDGSRASFLRILLLRNLLQWILQALPLGIGLVYWLVDSLYIVRDERRCLHDYMAGTIVVKA